MSWRLAAIALAVVLAPSCKRPELRPETKAAGPAVLFLSADLRGYLAPCGCSEEMRGGIARAAFQIAGARRTGAPVLYLDSGDSLFAHASPSPAEVPQAERKARAVAQALGKMGLAFHAVGELDEARGAGFRASLGLPDQVGDGFRLLDAGGHRVAVASAREGPGLSKACAAARAAGAELVLGLLHQPMDEAQKAAGLPGLSADLVVSGHAAGGLAGEGDRLVRGPVPVVRVDGRGRSLLRLDLSFGGPTGGRFELLKGRGETDREVAATGERIELLRRQLDDPGLRPEARKLRRDKLEELVLRREALAAAPPPAPEGKNSFFVRFIPLEPALESDQAVKEVVAAFDREVGALNLAWAREHGRDCPGPSAGEAAFVGNEPCRACHAAAFWVWEASKHAVAYQTLERDGKHLDLDCVRCHVTGADRPGGVCRLDRVEGRKGVGCESCHGPGSLHASAPSKQNIGVPHEERACLGCHDPENSRHFELGSFTNQIVGPGHGQPVSSVP
ncbi:MAG: multiheme c-type cytochrome [Myxococcaceae bacterium]